MIFVDIQSDQTDLVVNYPVLQSRLISPPVTKIRELSSGSDLRSERSPWTGHLSVSWPPHTTSRRELIIISNPSSSSRRVERPEPQDSPQSTLSSETILCLEKIYLYLAFKRSRRSVVSCATPRNGESRDWSWEINKWKDAAQIYLESLRCTT